MPYVLPDDRDVLNPCVIALADDIAKVSAKHGYPGAFAGELNYALTRLLQELPRKLIEHGQMTEELRYWIQPMFFGVLLDVVLEYKRRVNAPYEAAQIVKSGDCYDTPYYTRLVELRDKNDQTVGHQEIMMKRSPETLPMDVLPGFLIMNEKKIN